MIEARYWKKTEQGVRCMLCPHQCSLRDGAWGKCNNRKAQEGKLYSMVYGEPCAVNTDPVEKKPLYHFFPGMRTLSVGTAGCNLSCKNCQNHPISQVSPEETNNFALEPQQVVDLAVEHGCQAIAYTYTEPATFAEYVIDTAALAREQGIKNVIVSSGFINNEPLQDLIKVTDAANIDLKSFDQDIYKEISNGRLSTVLHTIKSLKEAGVWIEVTYLIVPGWTDEIEQITEMCQWFIDNDLEDVPLHFSRFFPSYELTDINPSPRSSMSRAWEIAKEKGLKHVYQGNISGTGKEHTYCSSCQRMVIQRSGFAVDEVLVKNGKCLHCGKPVEGVWA